MSSAQNAAMRKLLLLCLALACCPAYAVNKCIGEDGKVSYQSEPCPFRSKSSSVKITDTLARGNGEAPPLLAGKARQTEAERLTELTENGLRDQRRRELEQTDIPTAAMRIDQNRQGCAQRNAELESSKYAYTQNLWGVTHRSALASEQAALATQCESQTRMLQDHLASLRAECQKLACSLR
jgi:hypothetical protein